VCVSQVNILRVYWNGGQAKRNFEDARTRVEECKVGFEREVNFAHIETTSQFHKALAETLCSRTRVPHVTMLPLWP